MSIKKLLIIVLPLLLLAIFSYSLKPRPKTTSIVVGQTHLKTELACTAVQQVQGLSDRPSLASNQAMLFDLGEPQIASFWMKGMHFPIDIIWIDSNLKVIRIEKNALPSSFPNTFQPKSPVRFVLETNPGLVKEGETISLPTTPICGN